jgi:hypothetical protein
MSFSEPASLYCKVSKVSVAYHAAETSGKQSFDNSSISTKMQGNEYLPGALQEIHHSLEPYIKQRQEVIRIRQILAAHLSSHVHLKEGYPIFHPLSLVETSPNGESTLNSIRGLHKEYVRCLRTSIKARKEFAKTSKEHQLRTTSHHHSRGTTLENSDAHDESRPTLATFIDVVKYRRKHARLRIVQDYVDMVSLKLPATTDHLSSRVMPRDVGSLPQVPPEVMGTAEKRQGSERTDLKDLVDQLEKAVLRAKLLFQREQKFLAKIKGRNSTLNDLSASHVAKLQALGTTRNELIAWIEMELAKTADNSPDSDDATQFKAPEKGTEGFMDNELVSIQRQYGQYCKLRRALILAATGKLDQPTPIESGPHGDEMAENEPGTNSEATSHITHSYLVEMMSISNEQKAMIQQKSHFTISLAKHLKQAGQGLDRLSEESHLLPTHPLPGTTSHGGGFNELASLGSGIANHEKPDSSRRARAWVFAAGSARATTKDTILEMIKEARVDILGAQQTLLELQRLFGQDNHGEQKADGQISKGAGQPNTRDIWASLAGNLGAIK